MGYSQYKKKTNINQAKEATEDEIILEMTDEHNAIMIKINFETLTIAYLMEPYCLGVFRPMVSVRTHLSHKTKISLFSSV